MKKITPELAICIVLLIIIIYLYTTSYDHRYSVCGVWTATPQFCAESEITSMVLQLRDSKDDMSGKGLPVRGHMVITQGMNILSNQGIEISGWSFMKQRHPDFSEHINVKCAEEEILPTSLYIRRAGDRLYLENGETLYAVMYKI